MPSLLFWLLVIAFILAVMPNSAYAFGAGNVPSYGYLEDKAFRHGDIEDVLTEILKRSASGMLSMGGSKFKGLDVKRVYFGNWLRDYSQAVDVAGLKATSIQNILTICTVLGFLAHGFVTEEFEVTADRLGVYLPTEHIDNPKGYPDDARNYHPKLRGPVDPRELEIDLRTGMKNYIANEDGHWDTSKALIRRRLLECIDMGRKYRASHNKAEQYEAFRLLGTAMHTMEDFPAHSNFCELALVAMGHTQVFTHVGDQVRIRAPNGRTVSPLVTGTFGGDDFQHSLLGEAGDHISQSSISDLNDKMNNARAKAPSGDSATANKIKSLIASIPSSDQQSMTRDIDSMQANRAGSTTAAGGGKPPEQMTPQELYANIWAILKFRDSVVKKISYGIEKVPGLGPLIDQIMDSITVYVFQLLEPYLKPLMKTATTQLAASSATVINKLDQFEVFHDPLASDPTHSMLSKDHFNLILNEPAGNLAKIVVINTVKLVVHAWDNPSDNAHQVVETCLECLFHPDFHNPTSVVQREMMEFMQTWISSHSAGMRGVLNRLTKEAVRKHENVRAPGDASAPTVTASSHGLGAKVNTSHGASAKISHAMGHTPGASHMPHMPHMPAQAHGMINQMQGYMGGGGGGHFQSREMPSASGGGYSAPAHPPQIPEVSRDFPSAGGQSYSPPHGGPSYPQPHGGPSYPQAHGQSHKKDKGHKKNKSKDSDSDSDDSDNQYGGGHKPKKDKKDKHKKPPHPSHSPPAGGPPGGYPGAAASGYPGAAASSGYPGASYAAPSGFPAPSAYGGPPAPGYGPPSSFPSPPTSGNTYAGAPGYPGYGGAPPVMPNAPPAPYGGPTMPSAGYPGGPPPNPGYPQQGPGYPNQPSYPGQNQPPYGGW